jgi:hypothetical protein
MALHNYIRRISYDDVTFAEFDRKSNFISDNILSEVVARSESNENCSPCRINFVRDGIADSLIKQ